MTDGAPVSAAVIAVGSELLAPGRPDRNTPLLKERLAGLGIPTGVQIVVPDDRERIADAMRAGLSECGLAIVAGGLGPTEDDVTRDAAALVLGTTLVEDAPSLARIRRRFEERGIPMPERNRRQALVPQGARAVGNPTGSAPGVFAAISDAGRRGGSSFLVLLPGPPSELAAMFDAPIARLLSDHLPSPLPGPRPSFLRIAGLMESAVQERLDAVAAEVRSRSRQRDVPGNAWHGSDGGLRVGILASSGEIEVRLEDPVHPFSRGGPGSVPVPGLAADVADALAASLGDAVVSRAPGKRLEDVVGALLARRGERAAVAESLTGGLVAERITRAPGASAWFDLGVAAYANDAKVAVLGVDLDVLARSGAVSGETARAMAEGVRRLAGNEWGLALTGVAGPSGGTEEKPVGLVFLSVAGPVPPTFAQVVRRRFPGDRATIRALAAGAALDLLRRAILSADRRERSDPSS